MSLSSLSASTPPLQHADCLHFHPTDPVFQRRAADLLSVLQVRRATLADAEVIAAIASAVNVHTGTHPEGGFLVYTLRPDEYGKRVLDNQHVFLFLVGDEPVGFICGYELHALEQYIRDATLAHETTVCTTILAVAEQHHDRDFRFLDQIAILPKFQNLGLGESCFLHFTQTVTGPYYVGMVEAPIKNPRIAYWHRRGFIRIGQAWEPLPARFAPPRCGTGPGLPWLWGLYRLAEGGYRPQRLSRPLPVQP